jgi:hypothetical protein
MLALCFGIRRQGGGEAVGLEAIEERFWRVWFVNYEVGSG